MRFDPYFVSQKSVSLLLVKCLLFVCFVDVVNKSFVWCRQRLSGICSKLAFQIELLIVICTEGNALGRVPVDSVVRLQMVLSNVIVDITISSFPFLAEI